MGNRGIKVGDKMLHEMSHGRTKCVYNIFYITKFPAVVVADYWIFRIVCIASSSESNGMVKLAPYHIFTMHWNIPVPPLAIKPFNTPQHHAIEHWLWLWQKNGSRVKHRHHRNHHHRGIGLLSASYYRATQNQHLLHHHFYRHRWCSTIAFIIKASTNIYHLQRVYP